MTRPDKRFRSASDLSDLSGALLRRILFEGFATEAKTLGAQQVTGCRFSRAATGGQGSCRVWTKATCTQSDVLSDTKHLVSCLTLLDLEGKHIMAIGQNLVTAEGAVKQHTATKVKADGPRQRGHP